MRPDQLRGARVVVAGAGVSGLAAARALVDLGARVTVTDARPDALRDLPDGVAAAAAEDAPLPDGTALVVTGPGRRPDHPLTRAGVPVVGETELAWWLSAAQPEPPAWLVVTGTNGKTTTTEMLAAILHQAGVDAVACGNIGFPAVDAVRAGHRVLACELSSFQLHWSPSIVPTAGVVLNVAEDHLDWHGSMAAYAAAKARALTGPVAVAGIDDPPAAALLAAAPAACRVGVTTGVPAAGQLGVRDGVLVDAAFGGGELLAAADVRPAGAPGITDALAAAALARAAGVGVDAVRAALAAFRPGRHRAEVVAERDGVTYVDDSKATNPHAASASLSAAAGPVVWIAGGLLKGASVDELVAAHAGRMRAAVVIGTDRTALTAVLARHGVATVEIAPGDEVPGDEIMARAVTEARRLARPGDVVLLAPAAASMDQFRDYAARGDAFAAAVTAEPSRTGPRT